MTERCVKCFTEVSGGALRLEGGNIYSFCKFCANLLDRKYTGIVHDFLTDQLDLTKEEKDILDARIRRGNGINVWSQDGDNKAEPVKQDRERSKREDSLDPGIEKRQKWMKENLPRSGSLNAVIMENDSK